MKNLISYLFTVLFLLEMIPLLAQENAGPDQVTSLFKLNLFLPGISYEQKVGKWSTLNSDIYLDALLLTANESYSSSFKYYFTPSFKLEYRSYYNQLKRHSKGIRTIRNNGNYFGPVYVGRFSPTSIVTSHAWVNQLGGVWGIHRNSPSGFSFDLNAGLVYTFKTKTYHYYAPVQPVIQLRLGYWLGRKKN